MAAKVFRACSGVPPCSIADCSQNSAGSHQTKPVVSLPPTVNWVSLMIASSLVSPGAVAATCWAGRRCGPLRKNTIRSLKLAAGKCLDIGESFWMDPFLELAGFLARPALDDDFGFGEEFDGVAALAVEDAEETFLPAAEGEIGHRRGDADIDADISRGRFVAEFARGGTTGGEERGLVAVRTAAEKFHGFVNGIGVNQTEHGTENFRVGKLAV